MTIVQGDTPEWTITATKPDGTPLPLAGYTVTVTFKRAVTDLDADAAFQHFIIVNEDGTVAPGNSKGMELGPDGAESGIIIETMTTEESEALTSGSLKGDLEVRWGSKVHTPLLDLVEKVKLDYTNDAPV